MKKYTATLLFIVFSKLLPAQAVLSEHAKISILTASPWSGAAYSLYGHTAIWVSDDSTHIDAVFNYGIFDTSKPHFVYNFSRGKADYIMGVTNITHFLKEYSERGSEVVEQELNLLQSEKNKLWEALYINALPENRSYQYNYLYDNCVTRPRDLTEKFVVGTIHYPSDKKSQTARDLIHECNHFFPWMEFGIDLLIGSDADKPLTLRDKMFIPAYLMSAFDKATISRNDSTNVPLVKNKSHLVYESADNVKPHWITKVATPLSTAYALLALTIVVSAIQLLKLKKGKFTKIYDSLLFGSFGVAGFIICFMIFFSDQPATSPNWNVVWLNIFALIFAFLFWIRSLQNLVYIYHFINFAVLLIFLLLWKHIPQQLPLASIPFSINLMLRSATNLTTMRKRRLRKKQTVSSNYVKAAWGG